MYYFWDTGQLMLSIKISQKVNCAINFSIGVEYMIHAASGLFPGTGFRHHSNEFAYQSNSRCFLDRYILLMVNETCFNPPKLQWLQLARYPLRNVMVPSISISRYRGFHASLNPQVPLQEFTSRDLIPPFLTSFRLGDLFFNVDMDIFGDRKIFWNWIFLGLRIFIIVFITIPCCLY